MNTNGPYRDLYIYFIEKRGMKLIQEWEKDMTWYTMLINLTEIEKGGFVSPPSL